MLRGVTSSKEATPGLNPRGRTAPGMHLTLEPPSYSLGGKPSVVLVIPQPQLPPLEPSWGAQSYLEEGEENCRLAPGLLFVQ